MPKNGGNVNKLIMWILGAMLLVTSALAKLGYSDIKADINQNTLDIRGIQNDIIEIGKYMQGGRTLDSLILDKLTEIEEKLGE